MSAVWRRMDYDVQAASRFPFIGERLCLDFVNTEILAEGRRADLLGGFHDLVGWCVAARLLSRTKARDLEPRWRETPQARRAFRDALELRAGLREMAERLAAGRTNVPQPLLDRLNTVLRHRAGDLSVVRSPAGYELRYRAHRSVPSQMLVPIAESAVDLLTAGDLSLVKKCQNPRCILFFYDTTKNHARRWCSMEVCGNRAKATAHYRRNRRLAEDAPG